jgi:hypothetical protein
MAHSQTEVRAYVADPEGLFAQIASLTEDQARQALRFVAGYIPVAAAIAIDTILGVAGAEPDDEA